MSRSRTYRPRVEYLESRLVPSTFTVKNLLDGPDPLAPLANSLRAAIKAANDNGPGRDTIVFKAGLEGTIVLNGTGIPISNNLTILGPGASKIAVSGNFASRIFNIENGAANLTVKLQGLELRHGQTGANGGAIFAENLTLKKMVFTRNQGLIGGAIHCAGNLTVAKSTISGNSAGSFAGGIFCGATLMISGSTIAGNRASTYGGGIHSINNPATISGSTIAGNTAGGDGGGISCGTATISGCTITGNRAGGIGGGIRSNSTATIKVSTIAGNRAGTNGGGVFSDTVLISGSTISGNTAGGTGGGIHCTDTVALSTVSAITGSTITGNTAGGYGGGIRCENSNADTLTITGSTITANTAAYGGGISCNKATITGSTIAGNTATNGNGGGISCNTATITGSTIAANSASNDGGGISCNTTTITGSTITANTASNDGGGISISNLMPLFPSQIRNCTISGNRAAANGGGIHINATLLSVRNCTIAFNQAGSGGGMAIEGSSSPLLESCLVADNTAAGGKNLASVPFTGVFTLDHCLIALFVDSDAMPDPDATLKDLDGDPITVANPGNNLLGTAALPLDARLAPLAFNDGKTQTHQLKKDSPAINQGFRSSVPPLPFDQRGTPFKRKLGGAVDIGAFERQ